MHLIVAGWLSWLADWQNLLVILEVALGLGLVIFVHELGHFAVAKMCGVKCEKFYLGFDINGWKIASFQWGETEYGIGILPLGGYVKMLGQDDNPARAREEMERAKVQVDARPEKHGDLPVSVETDEPVAYDPRSYMAKSVPQRMAIISAGVIMNVIFAVVFAAIAYGLGVKETPCIISTVVPGGSAWQAPLQPGDQIIRIGTVDYPWFSDLQRIVTLGDTSVGLDVRIKRIGVEEPLELKLRPTPGRGGAGMLGIIGPHTSMLIGKPSALKHMAVAQANPPLEPGDVVKSVNGTPIENEADLTRALDKDPAKPLKLGIERKLKNADGTDAGTKLLESEVPPQPLVDIGLALEMGPLTAIQNGSPAAAAGLQVGDKIEAIDDQPVGDPMLLSDVMERQLGKTVQLTVVRSDADGKAQQTIKVNIVPRPSPSADETRAVPFNFPVSASPLGISFRVKHRVMQVAPDGAAAKAGLQAGDDISEVHFVPSDEFAARQKNRKSGDESEAEEPLDEKPIHLTDQKANWPAVFSALQYLPPDARLSVTYTRDNQQKEALVSLTRSTEFFNGDRGLIFAAKTETRIAHSFGEAVSLGFHKTVDSLCMVYTFLNRMINGQISLKSMGGIVAIASQAGYFAKEGLSAFLMFLTMISANLAVINFLPIPVLDGGHMVLLAIEGIRRKPVTERIVAGLSYVGLLLLVSLMVFTLLLDTSIIERFNDR